MTVYIALLRGINVGGKNKIKMAELRESLKATGLENVRTYIQSGNILFQSDKQTNQLRKLDIQSTTRNWKTVNKLAAMSKIME